MLHAPYTIASKGDFPSPCRVTADLVNSNSGMIHAGGAG